MNEGEQITSEAPPSTVIPRSPVAASAAVTDEPELSICIDASAASPLPPATESASADLDSSSVIEAEARAIEEAFIARTEGESSDVALIAIMRASSPLQVATPPQRSHTLATAPVTAVTVEAEVSVAHTLSTGQSRRGSTSRHSVSGSRQSHSSRSRDRAPVIDQDEEEENRWLTHAEFVLENKPIELPTREQHHPHDSDDDGVIDTHTDTAIDSSDEKKEERRDAIQSATFVSFPHAHTSIAFSGLSSSPASSKHEPSSSQTVNPFVESDLQHSVLPTMITVQPSLSASSMAGSTLTSPLSLHDREHRNSLYLPEQPNNQLSESRSRVSSISQLSRISPSLSAQQLVDEKEPVLAVYAPVSDREEKNEMKQSSLHTNTNAGVIKRIEFRTPSSHIRNHTQFNGSQSPVFAAQLQPGHRSPTPTNERKYDDGNGEYRQSQPQVPIVSAERRWFVPEIQSTIKHFPTKLLRAIVTCLLASPSSPSLSNLSSASMLTSPQHVLIDLSLLSSHHSSSQSQFPYDLARAVKALLPLSVSVFVGSIDSQPHQLYSEPSSHSYQLSHSLPQSPNHSHSGNASSGIHSNGALFSEIVIVHCIDLLPRATQLCLLQAMRLKQITVQGRLVNLPRTQLIIATHSHSHSHNANTRSSNEGLSRSLLDAFLFDLILESNFVSSLRQFLFQHSNDSGPPQPMDLWSLLPTLTSVIVSPLIVQYMRDILVTCRHHCRVAFGPSPASAHSFGVACAAQAMFSGCEFVRPADVDAVSESVLAHRVALRQVHGESKSRPYTARAIIQHLTNNVLRPPK